MKYDLGDQIVHSVRPSDEYASVGFRMVSVRSRLNAQVNTQKGLCGATYATTYLTFITIERRMSTALYEALWDFLYEI